MKISLLDNSIADRYQHFLDHCENASVYPTLQYKALLERSLPHGTAKYFLALDSHDVILGVLPCFEAHHDGLGKIINSLPFFSSPGGVTQLGSDANVTNFLVKAVFDYARDNDCAAGTIVGSPFEKFPEEYVLFDSFRDDRIGLVSPLPYDADDIEESLMAMYHSIRRNDIRRAIRAGVTVEQTDSAEDLAYLKREHGNSMERVGGRPKPNTFYEAVPDCLKFGRDYIVYKAMLDGKTIGAMLNLYGYGTVEYFVPAVDIEFRNAQPMALLIYQAMIDASKEGFRYWNWGGGPQPGVFKFKKKWGTVEKPYSHYTKLFAGAERLKSMRGNELLKHFPFFYVMPFSELDNPE